MITELKIPHLSTIAPKKHQQAIMLLPCYKNAFNLMTSSLGKTVCYKNWKTTKVNKFDTVTDKTSQLPRVTIVGKEMLVVNKLSLMFLQTLIIILHQYLHTYVS